MGSDDFYPEEPRHGNDGRSSHGRRGDWSTTKQRPNRRQVCTLASVPNFKLVLDAGDGTVPIVVDDYDSSVSLNPNAKFPFGDALWRVVRVVGRTVYCKPVLDQGARVRVP